MIIIINLSYNVVGFAKFFTVWRCENLGEYSEEFYHCMKQTGYLGVVDTGLAFCMMVGVLTMLKFDPLHHDLVVN